VSIVLRFSLLLLFYKAAARFNCLLVEMPQYTFSLPPYQIRSKLQQLNFNAIMAVIPQSNLTTVTPVPTSITNQDNDHDAISDNHSIIIGPIGILLALITTLLGVLEARRRSRRSQLSRHDSLSRSSTLRSIHHLEVAGECLYSE